MIQTNGLNERRAFDMANQAFQWSGIDNKGKRVSGVLKIADERDAQLELKKRHIEIISLKPKSQINYQISFLQKKVKFRDVLLFTNYLSTMVSSGLPIIQALDIIGRDQDNPKMHSFVTTMRNNVSSGKTLAESFSQYPQYFDELYCNLIKAGEKSGTLDKILKRLTNYLERTANLKRKVKKAMIYPAAIISVAIIISLILLLFVVPQFEHIFSSFGAKLPVFTRAVIGLSELLRAYWWLFLIGIFFAIWGLFYFIKHSERLRDQIDRWSLKIYIIGPVLKKSIIARFTRTMAITMEAGMPIIESMHAMADIMGNQLYKKAVLQISDDVAKGNQLNVAMNNTKLFPNMVVQMTAIGEAAGSLSDMLSKIADYYEEDVNTIVDNLSNLLEPLIMVVLGVIIGGFVVAMYLPIFKLGSLF